MKLFLPENIYSKIFLALLNNVDGLEIVFNQSSLLCKDLEYNTSAIALIPSVELINHRNLFVSSDYALSYDGEASNSYLYFGKSEREINKIYFRGDVAINEILLTKILFSERYSSEPEITLDPSSTAVEGRDYIVCGDENFLSGNYRSGISIADAISDVLDFPYVNFVFASPDKDSIIKFDRILKEIDFDMETCGIDPFINLGYNADAMDYLRENSGSIYFDMTENERESLNELIKLIFYHGMIDDMFDIKFVP